MTLFSESRDPRIAADHVEHTLFYQQSLRDMAHLLDCDASTEAILRARDELCLEGFIRLIVERSGIEAMVVDYGYPGDDGLDHKAMTNLLSPASCEIRYVLRLEPLMEKLIAEVDSFDRLVGEYTAQLSGLRDRGIDGLKTIVAYRTGLEIGRPAEAAASLEFDRIKERLSPGEPPRLESKTLLDFLVMLALEEATAQGVPVQFHTALGDVDIDLLKGGNPLLLRPILQESAFRDLPVVLLHCYPYLREAAYLANMYGNVYVDLSMTLPILANTSVRALEDVLGFAPTSKVIYGSDAPGLPDYLWLGALAIRRSLGRLLNRWIEDDGMPRTQALRIANQVMRDNARAVFG